jgi:hypothetical protein
MASTEPKRQYVVTFADGTIEQYDHPTVVVVQGGVLKMHRAGDTVNATYFSPIAWRSVWDRPFNPGFPE